MSSKTIFKPGRGGVRRTVILPELVNGLMYILSTRSQWLAIPIDLPPRSTFYVYFYLLFLSSLSISYITTL